MLFVFSIVAIILPQLSLVGLTLVLTVSFPFLLLAVVFIISLLASDSAMVRDLWARKNLAVYQGSFSAPVLSHGVVLVKVTPI